MDNRKRITGMQKKLGMILSEHFFEQGYKYTSGDEYSPFRIASKQFYNLLELQTCCDLKFRLEKAQKAIRKSEPLTTRTKLMKLNYIDVIMADEELTDTAIEILEKLIRRYEAGQFQININLDEEDILEDLI